MTDSATASVPADPDAVRSKLFRRAEIANARFVITGDFFNEQDKLSVNAYCFLVQGQTQVGDASFVSSFSDLYSRLDDFSISLARSLDVDCSDTQLARMRRNPTTFLDAMALYGEGLAAPPASEERGGFLLRAISIDPNYTDALSKLGIFYYEAGRFSRAQETLEKLVGIQPDYPHLYYNLGLVYRSKKQYSQAVDMYRRAISMQPEDTDTWNNMGATYYLMGMHRQAIEAFERTLEIDPGNSGARENLNAVRRNIGQSPRRETQTASMVHALKQHIEAGAALYLKEEYWHAIEEFTKALDIQPDNFKANNNIALAYLKLGEKKKAREHFERAFEADPTAIDVRDKLERLQEDVELSEGVPRIRGGPHSVRQSLALSAAGKVYLSRSAFEEAVNAFSRALELVPGDIDALSGLGTAYFGLGDFEKAREQFTRALSLAPENEAVKEKLAETDFILNAVKEESKRGESFELSLTPEIEARARFVRGNELYDAGRYEEAVSEYLRALDLTPASVETLSNLGSAYYNLQRYEEAKAVLKKAQQLDPGNELIGRNLDVLQMMVRKDEPAELKDLGIIPDSSGGQDEEEAESDSAKSLDMEAAAKSSEDPDSPVDADRPADRQNEIEPKENAAALSAFPDSARAHFNMGVIEEKKGNIEGALAHYSESVRREPDNAEAQYNLGNIYLRIGAIESAVNCYMAAVEIDPSFALAYNNMGVAYHRLEHHQQATAAWRQALEANPALESAQQNLAKFGAEATAETQDPPE